MTVKLLCGAEMLHVPKTGGSWVTSVLEENGLVSGCPMHKHADFDRNLHKCSTSSSQHLREALRIVRSKTLRKWGGSSPDASQPFRFCFVRHPLSWYESWWKYMKGRGWSDWGTQNSVAGWHPNSLLNGLGSDDFNEFVGNVVEARPGYVSELYYSFTKPGIGFIGKTETLRDDLAYVLDFLGHSYSRETVLEAPRENVSKTDQAEVEWDPDLRNLVMRLELSALIHFDYLSEDDRRDLGITSTTKPNKSLRRIDHACSA